MPRRGNISGEKLARRKNFPCTRLISAESGKGRRRSKWRPLTSESQSRVRFPYNVISRGNQRQELYMKGR